MMTDAEAPVVTTGAQDVRKLPTECISWRWNGNLGDDLIWAAQEEMFGDVLNLDQWLEEPEAVLVGGGTFIPKSPQHPDLESLSQRLPTIIFGTGAGDPAFWGDEHIADWLRIIENCRFVGVRGPLSEERLVSWGASPEKVRWIGDPGLHFRRFDGIRAFSGSLAVNLGTAFGRSYGSDEPGLERTVIEALLSISQLGWRISLVCAWEPDDATLDRIAAEVPVIDVHHWHDHWDRALASITQFDIVLSHKLHVAVTAAARGVPFVALNYRSKVDDFCRSIDWSDLLLRTEDLDPGEIVEKLTAVADDYEVTARRLRASVTKTAERLYDAVPLAVRGLLGYAEDP